MPVLLIDFDGTITKRNEFPNIGELNDGAIESIKLLQSKGCICCLWTCRHGKTLEMAKQFLENKGLIMDGYNTSPFDDHIPGGRKPIADVYIDDASYQNKIRKEPIDWYKITNDILTYYNL